MNDTNDDHHHPDHHDHDHDHQRVVGIMIANDPYPLQTQCSCGTPYMNDTGIVISAFASPVVTDLYNHSNDSSNPFFFQNYRNNEKNEKQQQPQNQTQQQDQTQQQQILSPTRSPLKSFVIGGFLLLAVVIGSVCWFVIRWIQQKRWSAATTTTSTIASILSRNTYEAVQE